MTMQTYTINDSLSNAKTQADSDTGSVLAEAAEVQISGGTIADSGTNHADLNTVANIATGPITATVSGTGTSLADSGLNNLGTSDQVTFQIVPPSGAGTGASLAEVATIAGRRKSSGYLIDFATNSASITGALSTFITAGAATTTTNFDTALAQSADAPIALSALTVDSTANITDVNKLFLEAEGPVTATITAGSTSVLAGTDVTTSSNDVVTIDFGTLASSTNVITEINTLAAQAGVTNITGTLTGVGVDDIALLSSSLDSDNSTINFTVDEAVTVAQAAGLLEHTDKSNAAVQFSAGISDALSAYAASGNTTTNLQNIVAEDTDVAATITGSALASAQDITDLNAIAALFDTNSYTATIVASFSGTKDKLYNY